MPNPLSILSCLQSKRATKAIFTESNPISSLEESTEELVEEQTKLPIPSTSEWVDAFNKANPIDSVISLEVDLSSVNWDQDVLELVSKVFPNLSSLHLFINPNNLPSLTLNFEKLIKLELKVDKKSKKTSFEISGCLPKLADFQLNCGSSKKINFSGLVAMLLSSANTIAKVSIFYRYGWLLAEEIGNAFGLNSSTANPHFVIHQSDSYSCSSGGVNYSKDKEGLYLQDWQAFQNLKKLKIEIDVASIIPLVNCLERFIEVREHLQVRATNLLLQSDEHNFLIEDPQLLKGFDILESLTLFSASELTQEGFVWLTTNLPNLKMLELINNHNPNFSVLELKSKTLTKLVLTHFHHLESYQINCPSLQELELDNCSGAKEYPQDVEKVLWCNDNFGERFFKDLLNGSPNVSLPELKKLLIWHNHNGVGGTSLVLEPLRLDINCDNGHQKLEEIILSRLSHIRSLTLKNLPKLNSLSIWDDFEEGEGWLEQLDLSTLQTECKVEIDCLGNLPKMGMTLE